MLKPGQSGEDTRPTAQQSNGNYFTLQSNMAGNTYTYHGLHGNIEAVNGDCSFARGSFASIIQLGDWDSQIAVLPWQNRPFFLLL